jgi:type IX secretion system PorP/SprF family membrane protein
MIIKSYITFAGRVIFFMIFTFSFTLSGGQQTPQTPVSYRIFSPFIFNPAIAGSKDFFTADFLTSNFGKSNSQIICGNTRLAKPNPGYFSSPGSPEYTNIGLGGSVFNELNGLSRNVGISGTGSYHIKLDKESLSFLSFGVTAKAVFNRYSGDPDLGKPAKSTFFPNFDVGIYYYGANLFAGISATNLLGNPEDPDSLGAYSIPVSRQFFFHAGYKLVLIRSLNFVLEPSLIINSDDSFSGKLTDMLKPALKLYAGNFCAGTYFNDFNNTSVFFQYMYPKFYLGTYFELSNNSPFYKKPLRAEFALGINISAIKSGVSRQNHW